MVSQSPRLLSCILILVPCFVVFVWIEVNLQRVPQATGVIHLIQNLQSDSNKDYAGIWTDPEGIYEFRIKNFVKAIEDYRVKIWKTQETVPWKEVKWRTSTEDNDYITIDPVSSGYLENVTKLEKVTVVFLAWRRPDHKIAYWTSLTDISNLMLQEYHNWIADPQICDWAKVKGLVHAPWGYRTQCSILKETSIGSSPLYEEYLNQFDRATSLYDASFRPRLDRPPAFITYMQIFQDVVVTNLGRILVTGVKIIPYPCNWNYKSDKETLGDFEAGPVYKEVFTFAQHTGSAIYHANIESIPRIAPYLDFLVKHDEIRIHTGADGGEMTKRVLEFLGIKRHRLVNGFGKAKVAYVPEGVPCGSINIHYVQLFNHKLREIIADKFGRQVRDTVVFIKRSKSRKLTNFKEVEQEIKKYAKRHQLKYSVYADDPAPSLHESMILFNKAVFIIASHGAGLYNMIYSEPGTYILEILNSVPRLVLCFQNLAYSLGHRYYGVTGSGGGDITVDFRHMSDLIQFYMSHAAKLKD